MPLERVDVHQFSNDRFADICRFYKPRFVWCPLRIHLP